MSENSTTHWIYAADKNLIPIKEGRRILWGDKEIALFNLGTEFLAVDNRCPHRQGPLADGIVAGRAVFCPLHNLKIELATGDAAGGEGRVRCYQVRVVDERVYIGFESSEENIPMKEVMAIIRPGKWIETKQKLADAGVFALTQRRVSGRGKQRGLLYLKAKKLGPARQGVEFISKRLVLIVVPEAQVGAVVNALISANQTGAIGDGKIFVSSVEDVIQVRTGEIESRKREVAL